MTVTGQPVATSLTVSEVADQAGTSPSAVRFYDKHGIIHATRNPGNQRRFTQDAICRISVAKLAQRAGLTIREIAELFADLPEETTPADWTRVGDVVLIGAEQRLIELKALLNMLGTDTKLCEADAALGD